MILVFVQEGPSRGEGGLCIPSNEVIPLDLMSFQTEAQDWVTVAGEKVELDGDFLFKKVLARVPSIESLGTYESALERLPRKTLPSELMLLKKVGSHPNIVKLEDWVVEDSVSSCVSTGSVLSRIALHFELCDGSDLQEIISDCPSLLTITNQWAFTIQILRGLDKLHSMMILHGDVHPTNVLVFRDRTVKICDLGSGLDLSDLDYLSRGFRRDASEKMVQQVMHSLHPRFEAPEYEQAYAEVLQEDERDDFMSGLKASFLAMDMWALGSVLMLMRNGGSIPGKEEGHEKSKFFSSSIEEERDVQELLEEPELLPSFGRKEEVWTASASECSSSGSRCHSPPVNAVDLPTFNPNVHLSRTPQLKDSSNSLDEGGQRTGLDRAEVKVGSIVYGYDKLVEKQMEFKRRERGRRRVWGEFINGARDMNTCRVRKASPVLPSINLSPPVLGMIKGLSEERLERVMQMTVDDLRVQHPKQRPRAIDLLEKSVVVDIQTSLGL